MLATVFPSLVEPIFKLTCKFLGAVVLVPATVSILALVASFFIPVGTFLPERAPTWQEESSGNQPTSIYTRRPMISQLSHIRDTVPRGYHAVFEVKGAGLEVRAVPT